jgi:protein CLEC16A
MNEFIYLASLNNRAINLQIIKSFSVLILNTSNTTTLYYIFSNNFINQIISNDYEKYDDDFISYYVNFIKSLSLKIDQTTIQFFFHKQYNSFPLLQSALKMYNHSDAMIKNVVRNTVLTVLKSSIL